MSNVGNGNSFPNCGDLDDIVLYEAMHYSGKSFSGLRTIDTVAINVHSAELQRFFNDEIV